LPHYEHYANYFHE